MPIAKVKPTREVPIGKEIPQIQSEDYKGIVVNVDDKPIRSLLTYTSGYYWKVDYYSQVINSSNDLKALDPSQSKVYQQYKKIKDLELIVQDPLTESQDEKTKLMSVQGSAVVANAVVPEAGDMFIASVDNGKTGLFVINKTDRMSYYTESVFSIDYQLLGYTENNIDRISDLENKVVETLYYNKLFKE